MAQAQVQLLLKIVKGFVEADSTTPTFVKRVFLAQTNGGYSAQAASTNVLQNFDIPLEVPSGNDGKLLPDVLVGTNTTVVDDNTGTNSSVDYVEPKTIQLDNITQSAITFTHWLVLATDGTPGTRKMVGYRQLPSPVTVPANSTATVTFDVHVRAENVSGI